MVSSMPDRAWRITQGIFCPDGKAGLKYWHQQPCFFSLGLFTGARDLPALKLGLVQVGKNGINPSGGPII